jgi:hypothetical protein
MILKNFFKDIIKLAVTNEDLLPVENIMLHIRMRGLKKLTSTDRRKIVFMAVPFAWLMQLLLFPFAVLSYIRSFIMSLAGAFIPYYVFGFKTQAEFFMLSLLLWALMNYKPLYCAASEFFIDLLDLLSFGSLTILAVYAYSTLPKSRHMEFLTNKNYSLVSHFCATRQIFGGDYEPAWESYFSGLAIKYLNNKEALQMEVEKYWEDIGQPNNLYETHYPHNLDY